MADDTYGQLLDSIGFPAADAASAEERTKRKLDLGVSGVNLQTGEQAKGINNDWEDRGMFQSGGRHVALVTNEAQGANKIGQLAIGAADDIAQGKAEIARAQAERAAQDQQLAFQQRQFDADLAAQQQQAALDAQLKQAQIAAAYQQGLVSTRNPGGFSIADMEAMIAARKAAQGGG